MIKVEIVKGQEVTIIGPTLLTRLHRLLSRQCQLPRQKALPALLKSSCSIRIPSFSLFPDMTEIRLKKGEPVDKALRRFKKKLDREQTLKEFRNRRRFEKPSARKRRKSKAARFAAMLKARYADD
jgi:small subunit ribosomal protein S21